MRKWFIVGCSALALAGCQTVDNAALKDDQVVTGSVTPTVE